MGEARGPGNASQTRPSAEGIAKQNHTATAGKVKTGGKTKPELHEIKEAMKFIMETCRGWLEAGPKLKFIEDNFGHVLQLIQALAQKKDRGEGMLDPGPKGGTLDKIMERLDRMEKKMATPSAPNLGTPLWSEVAVGGKTKAVVEVRMNSMEGEKEESDEEKLRRIKVAIPDARAIIHHPRAKGKISVVVPSTARRDHIITSGINVHEGIKLIRRPRLVMVMGVPIDTNITNGDSYENNEWKKAAEARNAIKVEKVEWLYGKERLEKIRREGTQKKGSIIVEVATENDQKRLVREGMLHGALWLPVKIWDVAMRAVQCFKCWRWGHTQSVCNATQDTCGHCAKAHSTRDCASNNIKDARCAGCKKPGHFAWMTRNCDAHKLFQDRQKGTEVRLQAATLAIQQRHDQTTSAYAPDSQDGFTLVENPSKKRKGPGRPIGSTNAAKAAGQRKFQFSRNGTMTFGDKAPASTPERIIIRDTQMSTQEDISREATPEPTQC